MARDFANRAKPGRAAGRAGGPPRRRKRAAGSNSTRRKPAAKKKPFHGPSFSAGIVLGAALVLAGEYLPELLEQPAEVATVDPDRPDPKPTVEFRFDERLRSQQIQADPQAYVDATQPREANMEYLIQAASFQNEDDADTLRAQLLLTGLPAATNPVKVGDKPWYRVTVGPFPSSVESGRALTKLRELDLDAFLIKREIASSHE